MKKKYSRESSSSSILYEVFGRLNHGDALTHIGSLEAGNIDLARARAMMLYSERRWIELCISPAKNFVKLIAHENEVALGFA